MKKFEAEWIEVYQKRNLRLADSDWTQMPDVMLSDEKKAKWATYRQLLRDVPQKFPKNVDWDTVNPFLVDNLFPKKPQ